MPKEIVFDEDAIKNIAATYALQCEPYMRTTGNQKMWNYLLDVIERESVQKKIRSIRTENDIPLAGFKSPELLYDLPEEWLETHTRKQQETVKSEVKQICEQYGFHYAEWSNIFLSLIFYDRIFTQQQSNAYNLCRVEDSKNIEIGTDLAWSDAYAFPVMLRISPYASQRDIVDYVKKTYKVSIKSLQRKYQKTHVNIARLRTRDTQKKLVARFIYEHRELSHKNIRTSWKKSYPGKDFPDDGSLGKIKQLVIARRSK